MITSYVTPQRSMLYLSLVGSLTDVAAEDLVNEYYERQSPRLRQCILDLAGVEASSDAGLDVLHRLSLLAQVDSIEFSVVSARSAVESKIREAASRFWVQVVDGRDLPFARRAS